MNDDSLLLKARKFEVRRCDVVVADGSTHQYEFVTNPGAAVILPVLPDGRWLLIGNYRAVVDLELLELPAGTIDPPEIPLECAGRELTEETGYRAGRLEPLLSFYSTPGFCSELLHVFVATELVPGPHCREAGERIRLVPMTCTEAIEAIREHRIVDGKTIAALLYYDRFTRGQGNRV